ncbi:MAG: flagellar protein FlgN [Bacillota bacterium]|nr:flagellar protein FlgN [Bacillota bacterium]
MEGLLITLVEILEQENRIYKDLLEISKHKTDIIVEGKVSELDRMTGVEQKMVVNVGQLEKQREELIKDMARHLEMDAQEINMELIIDGVDGQLKERFLNIKGEVTATLNELKQVNDLNSELIEKSLEYINFSIGLITDNSNNTTYNSRRDKEKGEGLSFFDQKV